MEISTTYKYGFSIIYKTENVKVEEDIEERIYEKKPDGKIDYSIPPYRDISDEILIQFSNILDELIDYRKREFDSTVLIKRLFEKLSKESVNNLLLELNKEYSVE